MGTVPLLGVSITKQSLRLLTSPPYSKTLELPEGDWLQQGGTAAKWQRLLRVTLVPTPDTPATGEMDLQELILCPGHLQSPWASRDLVQEVTEGG